MLSNVACEETETNSHVCTFPKLLYIFLVYWGAKIQIKPAHLLCISTSYSSCHPFHWHSPHSTHRHHPHYFPLRNYNRSKKCYRTVLGKSTKLSHLEELSWELNWWSPISVFFAWCYIILFVAFYLIFIFSHKMINIPATWCPKMCPVSLKWTLKLNTPKI